MKSLITRLNSEENYYSKWKYWKTSSIIYVGMHMAQKH